MNEQEELIKVEKPKTVKPQPGEAKLVSRIVKEIDGLSAWGCDEVNARLQRRVEMLSNE